MTTEETTSWLQKQPEGHPLPLDKFNNGEMVEIILSRIGTTFKQGKTWSIDTREWKTDPQTGKEGLFWQYSVDVNDPDDPTTDYISEPMLSAGLCFATYMDELAAKAGGSYLELEELLSSDLVSEEAATSFNVLSMGLEDFVLTLDFWLDLKNDKEVQAGNEEGWRQTLDELGTEAIGALGYCEEHYKKVQEAVEAASAARRPVAAEPIVVSQEELKEKASRKLSAIREEAGLPPLGSSF